MYNKFLNVTVFVAVLIVAVICAICGTIFAPAAEQQEQIYSYHVERPPQEETIDMTPSLEETEDYRYLLMTLVGECHYCDLEMQLMVGSVVLNRVNSPYFKGDTIKDIVTAPKQYQCFVDGNAYREPTETNKRAVAILLQDGSFLPENVVYQAEFKQGSGVYQKVYNTYFCYL